MPDWVMQGLLSILAVAASYGAIRADLRHLHESVKRAHERIDGMLVARHE
jgi:hypothetical protein